MERIMQSFEGEIETSYMKEMTHAPKRNYFYRS